MQKQDSTSGKGVQGALPPDGARGAPLWRQLKGVLLAAEGAGRRLASLPGLRGVPEKLFFPFFRAAAGGTEERRKLGHGPKPQVKGGCPSPSRLN